ncbi:hypothetical protein [Sphingomonas sp. 2378]|uniref:hypothetical protein n=1 Tax=Sphingomonas sp. 2378 TaxID=1219748 RepID=UPI00311B11FB
MDLETVRAWGRGDPQNDDLEVDAEPVDDENVQKNSPFRDLLRKITDKARQQNEMIAFVNTVGRDMPGIMLANGAVGDATEHGVKVESGDRYTIVALEPNDVPAVTENIRNVATLVDGLSQLPEAILLSIVGTFDSQMSDIVRTMLEVRPEKVKLSEKTMSLARILRAESIAELAEEAVTDEVYLFSRESHDIQVSYIEDKFDVDIKKDWKRWPDFIEVFERRNLVAHGEKLFTKRYVDNCLNHGHKGSDSVLGMPIQVTIRYIRQCLSILTECAILTTFSLWRKHVRNEEEDAFGFMVMVSFDLIKSRQYSLAAYVCEYALSLKTKGRKENVRLRLVVNLASAHAHLDQRDAAEGVLDKEDWVATSDDFRICVAALRRDVDEVIRLMPITKASGNIDIESFRDWPVFDFVKKDKKFREAFEKNFGEIYKVKRRLRPARAASLADHTDELSSVPENGILH